MDKWSICKVEAQLNFLKKEMQNYTSRCATEAKKFVGDVDIETHNVDFVEREVADVLEASKLKLQEAIKQNEEEIQISAWELYALVDSVSKYRVHGIKKFRDEEQPLRNCRRCIRFLQRLLASTVWYHFRCKSLTQSTPPIDHSFL